MISIQEIEKLASLSRIALSQTEKETLRANMDSILGYIDQINGATAQLNTKKTAGIIRNVMREDGNPHETGIFTEALLSVAPRRQGNYIKVKKIL